ncbi:hypothetical protein ACS0TY_030763 [Phlomoides rotata]
MRKKLISNSYDMKISSVHNEKNTRIKHNINDRGKRTQLSNKYLIPSTQNQFDSLREEGDYEFLGELVESPSVPVRCSPQKLSWAEMVEDETTLALSSYAPGCNKEGARVPTDSVFKTDKRKVPIASDYNLRSKPQHRPLGNDLPTYAAALVATSTMALELDLSCWALEAEFDLSSFRGSVIKGVKLKAKTQNDPVICRFPVAQSSLLPQHRIPPLSLFPLTTTHVIFLPTRSTATPPIAAASHLQQHPLFLLTLASSLSIIGYMRYRHEVEPESTTDNADCGSYVPPILGDVTDTALETGSLNCYCEPKFRIVASVWGYALQIIFQYRCLLGLWHSLILSFG